MYEFAGLIEEINFIDEDKPVVDPMGWDDDAPWDDSMQWE